MTEPIGPQYGLNPRLDHAEPKKVYTSRDVLANPLDYDEPGVATEFGGVPGLVQPPPHVPTGIERMHQIYAIDPADPGDGVQAPELEGTFNTAGME